MFRWLVGIIDRMFIVAGAMMFSQAPHFYHMYTQRLGGHMAELQRQLAILHQSAEKSGKSLDALIQKFLSHMDRDMIMQGEFMHAMQVRYGEITSSYFAMVNATPLSRPWEFLRYLQWDIAQMTLQDFHFGLSFTLESGLYALCGMGMGYLLFWSMKTLCLAPWSTRTTSDRY